MKDLGSFKGRKGRSFEEERNASTAAACDESKGHVRRARDEDLLKREREREGSESD